MIKEQLVVFGSSIPANTVFLCVSLRSEYFKIPIKAYVGLASRQRKDKKPHTAAYTGVSGLNTLAAAAADSIRRLPDRSFHNFKA